jgi:hypothetical protein
MQPTEQDLKRHLPTDLAYVEGEAETYAELPPALKAKFNGIAVVGWPAAIRLAMAGKAFKAWVHSWLDAHGVPHDPEPEHTAQHGCRISGRMQWLLRRAVDAEDELALLRPTLRDQAEAHSMAMEWHAKQADCIKELEADNARLRAALLAVSTAETTHPEDVDSFDEVAEWALGQLVALKRQAREALGEGG